MIGPASGPHIAAADSHLDEYPWGHIRWSVNAELTGSEGLTVGRVHLDAHAQNPRHYHPNCDEALYVISGRTEHLVGEKW